jgi:hypothetical protein
LHAVLSVEPVLVPVPLLSGQVLHAVPLLSDTAVLYMPAAQAVQDVDPSVPALNVPDSQLTQAVLLVIQICCS